MKQELDMQAPVTPKGYSLEHLASGLGVSVGFLRLEIRRGRLQAKKLGRRVIVLQRHLDAYLADSEAANKSTVSGRKAAAAELR